MRRPDISSRDLIVWLPVVLVGLSFFFAVTDRWLWAFWVVAVAIWIEAGL